MTPTEWHRHVKAWQTSGQTKRAYTRRHQLSYSRFLYWSNKPAKLRPDPMVPDAELLPVTITDHNAEMDCLGILEFPNGVKLHINSTELLSGLCLCHGQRTEAIKPVSEQIRLSPTQKLSDIITYSNFYSTTIVKKVIEILLITELGHFRPSITEIYLR